MAIYPDCDMRRWESCDNPMMLANAQYYYTKEETDNIISSISGMSEDEVQELIDENIASKADKSEVNELAQQVRQNTEDILNRYTKAETNSLLTSFLSKLEANSMFAEYSRVDGNILSLNDKNVGL